MHCLTDMFEIFNFISFTIIKFDEEVNKHQGEHSSGRSRGGSEGSLEPPYPSPHFKYPMKMK